MEAAGREPPSAYYEQPEINPDCDIYWRAFCDLTTERSLSMSVGPIPRSRIRQYGVEVLELEADALERFCAILGRVDDDYTEMVNARLTSKDRPGKLRAEASMSDPDAVRSLFRGMRAQSKPIKIKKPPRNRNQNADS